MKKTLAALAATAVIALAWPHTAFAQVFKVGSFSACTTANCQSVVTHNLGVVPNAMILWTNGKTGTTFTANYMWGFGMTDGTNSWSAGAGSQNNVGTTAPVSRRDWNSVIQVLQGTTSSGTVLSEASFTSWTSTQFTITWGTNGGTAYTIHYVLIGGASVSAQVLSWESPSTNTNDCCPATAKPTTLTFQPDLVLNVNHGTQMSACSPCSGSAAARAGFGLGVMDPAGNMWANGFISYQTATKDTQRGQQATGKFIYGFNNSLTVNPVAVVCTTSPCLYANGFRFNYTTDFSLSLQIALALHNVNFKIGTFNKCSSTGGCSNQNAISGLGFQPGVVLLTSVQNTTSASPVANSMYGFGASDGTNEASSAITDADAVATSSVWGIDSSTKAFTKVNNVGTASVAPTVDAQADIAMNATGFTVTWSPNDTATTEMLYLALGPLNATSVTLASFTATRLPDGKVRLDWRTGYEVDNVGFRIYREQNGQRVRINSSLVPGTAVIGGGRGKGEQTYTWSDAKVPADAGPVQYWLEDVDLKGKTTLHGPIVPAAPAARDPR